MDFFFIGTALELIDTRSFSNLWYWIALAVAWSRASYWVVGVPFDLVRRAARGDGAALDDLTALAGVHAQRMVRIADASGLLMTGFAWFAVTALALLGFLYRVELAQALLALAAPMSVVAWLNLRTARAMLRAERPDELPTLMLRQRRRVQALGIASIFFTAMWGMWVNMTVSVLGG